MSKPRTWPRRILAYGLFALCWYCAVQWQQWEWKRDFYTFWILVSGAAGILALYTLRWSRQKHEQAMLQQRRLDVLRLAEAEGGQLTATRTAARLGVPLRIALQTLRSLEDGVRVDALVTDEGVRVYRFPELMHAPARREPAR
jgi:hypothetical protein